MPVEGRPRGSSTQGVSAAAITSATPLQLPSLISNFATKSSRMAEKCFLRWKELEYEGSAEGLNNMKIMAEVGAAPSVISVMDAHGSQPGIQEDACHALATLSHGGVANKKLVSQAKGAAALVRAMQDFEAREQLQVEACAALANLAAGDAACKQGVADAMGASAMCHAMGAHPDSDEVQQQGCRGLLNLSTGGGKCERAVMDAKGAKMAVAAMLRHPADPGVQWLGCRVLANVACGPSDGRVAVRLASGAEAVCATMQTHTALPHQLEACRALAFIAAGDANDKESVRATDAPALVVKAMCDFPLQDDLQEIALGVLVGLSQGDAKCKQAVKEAARGLGTGPTTKLVQRLSATGDALQSSVKMMNNNI